MGRKWAIMKLFPGKEEEYKKRHDALWQELIDAIHRDGGKNYTIFHDPETNLLFEYIEIEDEQVWASRGGDEVTQKWWDYMADIMETNPDNSPVSIPLPELFYME